MSNVVLTLGGVAFRGMEVPEKISFGGKQRIAAWPLVGGGRVVQALGQEDGKISFAGIFSGADAVSRAQLLDMAVSAGAQLPLAWGGFYYNVVIAQFKADYRKPMLIPFSISCVVVDDMVAALAAGVSELAGLVSADWNEAVSLSGQAGLSLAAVVPGDSAGVAPVQAQIGSMIAGAGSQIVQENGVVSAGGNPAAGVSALVQLGNAAGQLAALTGMSGYVNRAATNLAEEVL